MSNSNRSLGKQISYIARTIRWIADRELERTRLSSATYPLLRAVFRHPGITQNELSEQTQIDKATAAKGVARLESLQYMKRLPDTKDGRVRRLYLTDAGEHVIPMVHAALRRVTEICASHLTKPELRELFSLLDRVEDAVSTYATAVKQEKPKP